MKKTNRDWLPPLRPPPEISAPDSGDQGPFQPGALSFRRLRGPGPGVPSRQGGREDRLQVRPGPGPALPLEIARTSRSFQVDLALFAYTRAQRLQQGGDRRLLQRILPERLGPPRPDKPGLRRLPRGLHPGRKRRPVRADLPSPGQGLLSGLPAIW